MIFISQATTGWSPIYNFSGIFNGNGYTISNLQINRNADRQGLFGIASGGIVRDLGLLNVKIDSQSRVGALAGINAGTVIGSYATGEIAGRQNTGGLIGVSSGLVMNSHTNVLVRANNLSAV